MLKLRMNSIIQKSSDAYEIGTITYNPSSDCTFSSGNYIMKFGNIGILSLTIVNLPETPQAINRTLINNLSIKPARLFSQNVPLRAINGNLGYECYLNINTDGTVQLATIGNVAQQTVRELFVFPLV